MFNEFNGLIVLIERWTAKNLMSRVECPLADQKLSNCCISGSFGRRNKNLVPLESSQFPLRSVLALLSSTVDSLAAIFKKLFEKYALWPTSRPYRRQGCTPSRPAHWPTSQAAMIGPGNGRLVGNVVGFWSLWSATGHFGRPMGWSATGPVNVTNQRAHRGWSARGTGLAADQGK